MDPEPCRDLKFMKSILALFIVLMGAGASADLSLFPNDIKFPLEVGADGSDDPCVKKVVAFVDDIFSGRNDPHAYDYAGGTIKHVVMGAGQNIFQIETNYADNSGADEADRHGDLEVTADFKCNNLKLILRVDHD